MQVLINECIYQGNPSLGKMFIPIGLPSPSGRYQKRSEAGGLQRNQTIGQRIMGNMMDNLFIRSFTSKSKARPSDVSVPSSPAKVLCYWIYLN